MTVPGFVPYQPEGPSFESDLIAKVLARKLQNAPALRNAHPDLRGYLKINRKHHRVDIF